MAVIADFRTKILLLLDDVALARYTSDQVDEALREALNKYNRFNPIEKTYIINGTGAYRITLPADFAALAITRIEWLSSSPTVDDAIPFYAYKPDEQWEIELRSSYSTSDTLIIYYAATNFIDGFDSGAGTSIPAEDVDILALGAAGFAALTRAHSRAEAINLVPNETQNLLALGQKYLTEFYNHFATKPKTYVVAIWKLDTERNF
jgi:hypothetical protein